MTNNVAEMIGKYNIQRQGDNLAIYNRPKAAAEVDAIRADKPEIMAELIRREEEQAAKTAAKEAARIEEARAIRAGERKIKVDVEDYDGIPLYVVYGEAANALKEIGGARDIAYSTQVNREIIKALGKEFTLAQAAELTRPAREAKEAAKKAADDEREAKFVQARETGQKVELRSWMEDCNDPREECSTDFVQEYAMPDGTTRRERQHTW